MNEQGFYPRTQRSVGKDAGTAAYVSTCYLFPATFCPSQRTCNSQQLPAAYQVFTEA